MKKSSIIIKEIKNAPSASLSYISTRDQFKNTREVLAKHEPQVNASRTSRVLIQLFRGRLSEKSTKVHATDRKVVWVYTKILHIGLEKCTSLYI